MIVTDIHALIWFIEGDHRLGIATRILIDQERENDGVVIPAIGLWEATILVDKNKITLSRSPALRFGAIFSTSGCVLAPINPTIGIDAGSLTGDIHGDPADRLIVATARFYNCALVAADRKILAYAQAGHVVTIDARR